MGKRIALKKSKKDDMNDKYRNCDFVLGSVAEVERLWSIAKSILGTQRMHMTPITLEALLFLRMNKRYWDLSLASTAMAQSRSNRTNNRLQDHVQEDKMNDAGIVDE